MCPLRGNQDPAPRLHSCFLTAPPLSLHALPLLISNCLNLPVGTQGSSGWLNKAYLLQARKGEVQKDFCAQEPHRVLLSFTLNSVRQEGTKSILPALKDLFKVNGNDTERYSWCLKWEERSWKRHSCPGSVHLERVLEGMVMQSTFGEHS